MKTQFYGSVRHGRIRIFLPAPFILVVLFSLFFHFNVKSQQSSLPCNEVTPWVPGTFAVNVDFSSSALACWDGDVACIIPGSLEPANVVDSDTDNFARGEILVGGTLTLSVTDPVNTYSAGNFTGFVISSTLLEVDVFDGLILRTYLDNVLQETFFGFNLIGLESGLFDDPYTIGFVTSSDFDEVEITFAAGLGAGFYDVHYAVMERFCEGPDLVCNEETQMNTPDFPMTIDYALTGSTGISLGTVDNPESAISASTSDFASFENIANVLDTVSIAVEEQITDYPAGTFVGFDIENISILGLDLLENMIITSYLNGVEQEVMTGNDLLIGAPLFNSSGRMTVGFVTSTGVDKVRFSIAYPLNVDLGVTLIYSAIFREFCEGPDLPCNELTSIYSPDYPIYFNVVNSGFTGAACVGCTLEDPGNVIDNDPASYAEIDITAGVATIGHLAVKDALTDYPANSFAGFHIENVQLVDVSVLSGITISTFLDGVFAESASGLDILLTAGTDLLVNQGEFYAGFLTTEEFDEVRISLTNVGMIDIGTTRIYEAVLGMFCPTTIECDTNYFLNTPEFPVYIDFQLTGVEGGVCALCEVEDPDEVITASNTDYATITIPVGALETGSIAVRDALFTYPPGTIAGFVIEDVNLLLQINLFQSITISTYLDGNFQEFATGNDLIDVSLLVLFINADPGVYNIGFQTTMPFDEIRITVGSLASVINIINVFGAFVDTHNSDDDAGLNCAEPPVAMDDSATTDEDTPVSIDVLDNDSDPDSPLDIPQVIDGPTHGTAVINPADSTFTYTPDPSFVGQDTFSYSICDDAAPPLCDTAMVFITVSPVTDTIVETIPEDSMITICVSELTTFNETGDNLATCEDPNDGNVAIVDTCATYTPDMGFNGQDTFCLVTCDPVDPLICDTTIVIIIVTPANDPPVANDDSATTDEDTSVSIDVLDNDTDPDSPLDIPQVIDGPTHGTAVINPADSTFTYTPDPNYVGVDTFSYSICDDGAPPLCDTALVFITINPVTDTIVETIPEDSMITICVSELTTFNETGDNLATCEDPDDGNLAVVDTCATYTPDPGFNGQDTFCLVTCDPVDPLICDTTIVIIIVTPVNDPPVATDDSATTDEDTPVSIVVLDNDSDPDSPLDIPQVIDGPMHGTAVINPADSTFTYTPDPNYVGVDTFSYSICDDGAPPLCDTALVFITINPVTDTIVETIPEDSMITICVSELTTFNETGDNLATCEDPDDGNLAVVDTCATYTPDPGFNGQDTFCLVTCDPVDPLICDTTIVIIIVTPVNDPPVATNDSATTDEDTPVSIVVLDNDSDPDSPLDIPQVIAGPMHGTAVINPADSTFTYTPDPNYVGVDTFSYSICDDGAPPLCDTALVFITVNPVTDTITEHIPEDSTITFCVSELTKFSEPGDNLSLCGGPSNGMVVLSDTCVTYTPDMNYYGEDTFCVVSCDPKDPSICDTTIIIIVIDPYNDPPVANDDTGVTDEDTPVTIDVLDNDSDPDSPLGVPEILDLPLNGTVVINPGDSTATYTPNMDFMGVDSFTYYICDYGDPLPCDTATVFVTVLPVTDTVHVTILQDSTFVVCGDTLSIFSSPIISIDACGNPSFGTLEINGICATYTPDQGYTGQDTFCLVACDPNDPSICDTTLVMMTIFPPACPKLHAFVYLEGSNVLVNGEEGYAVPMRTDLNDENLLPGQSYEDPFIGIHYTPAGQPYSGAPWHYAGDEGDMFDSGGDPLLGDAGYPETVVDWVLVSLRSDAEGVGGPQCMAAALLHEDGWIEIPDSFDCCDLNLNQPYYLVVEHRNHLIVMSDTALYVSNDTLFYDFRTQQSYLDDPFNLGASAQMEILPGVYAMLAGNGEQVLTANADTDINSSDRVRWGVDIGQIGEYRIGDYNLNGDSNYNDRVVWERNNGKFTSIARD